MQNLTVIIFILIGLTGCATKNNERYAALKSEYKTVATELVQLIKSNNHEEGKTNT